MSTRIRKLWRRFVNGEIEGEDLKPGDKKIIDSIQQSMDDWYNDIQGGGNG
jgi:hypothetical protein